jgi:hypothetical protein
MTLTGYTMMCEQTGPKQLVRDVALAEQASFARDDGQEHIPTARSLPFTRVSARS